MESLIRELAQAYTQAGLACGDGLFPPAADADVARAADEIGQPTHNDLRALWQVHGGQEDAGAGTSGLFGRHRLLAPAEAVEAYRLIWDYCEQDVPPPLATPKLFNRPVLELVPFASWDAYALCVHAVSGEVWEFLPSPGLLRHRPSIEAVLRELLAAVRSGEAEPDLAW